MRYISKSIALLKQGDFKTLLTKAANKALSSCYRLRARIEDARIGAISIDRKKDSRFADQGAYATESTNYIWLDKIFRSRPLKPDDVFVDVGCGEGRVLTYLYLRGFRGRMTGIELDGDVAATAARRTQKCANISVVHANVLDCADVIGDATAIYIFNPFNESIVNAFVQMIEQNCNHPLILYYSNDIYARVLDKREHWFVLRRNILKCPSLPDRRYSIYAYRPEKIQNS